MFGSPIKTTFTDGGLEIWTYEFDDLKMTAASYLNPFGTTFTGTKKELVVLFDENEIVKRARMSESDVGGSLGEPLRTLSNTDSETWYYNRDIGVHSSVDFDKKLLRFRVKSWKEPKDN